MKNIKNKLLSIKASVLSLIIKILVNVRRAFFIGVPLSFSLFIYTNAAESVFRTDYTSIANAISYYERLPIAFSAYEVSPEPNLTGNTGDSYGKPISMLIPSANRKIEFIPAIIDGRDLYSKPNSTHYLSFETDDSTSIFAYMMSSWRTIPDIDQVVESTNLYIDTNRDWRYVYQIQEVLEISLNGYIPPKSDRGQILLFIKESKNERYYVIRAEYRTILPIGR